MRKLHQYDKAKMLPELKSGFTISLKVNVKKLVYLKLAFIN